MAGKSVIEGHIPGVCDPKPLTAQEVNLMQFENAQLKEHVAYLERLVSTAEAFMSGEFNVEHRRAIAIAADALRENTRMKARIEELESKLHEDLSRGRPVEPVRNPDHGTPGYIRGK